MVVFHKIKARMMGIKYIPLFLYLALSLRTERQQGEIHTHRQTNIERHTKTHNHVCLIHIYIDT